jgi:hypothetical protein
LEFFESFLSFFDSNFETALEAVDAGFVSDLDFDFLNSLLSCDDFDEVLPDLFLLSCLSSFTIFLNSEFVACRPDFFLDSSFKVVLFVPFSDLLASAFIGWILRE